MRTGKIISRSYADGIERVQTKVEGESMTRQDQADLVNINKIYARTQRGEIVLAADRMPQFGDFSNVNSYDVMLEMINEAEDAFLSLPAEERKRYNNDPAEYYAGKHNEATKAVAKLKDKEEKERLASEKAKALEEAKSLIEKNQSS